MIASTWRSIAISFLGFYCATIIPLTTALADDPLPTVIPGKKNGFNLKDDESFKIVDDTQTAQDFEIRNSSTSDPVVVTVTKTVGGETVEVAETVIPPGDEQDVGAQAGESITISNPKTGEENGGIGRTSRGWYRKY